MEWNLPTTVWKSLRCVLQMLIWEQTERLNVEMQEVQPIPPIRKNSPESPEPQNNKHVICNGMNAECKRRQRWFAVLSGGERQCTPSQMLAYLQNAMKVGGRARVARSAVKAETREGNAAGAARWRCYYATAKRETRRTARRHTGDAARNAANAKRERDKRQKVCARRC